MDRRSPRQRVGVVLLAVALVAVGTPWTGWTGHTLAGTPTPSLALPPDESLAVDALTTVTDTPADTGRIVDLTPAELAAWDAVEAMPAAEWRVGPLARSLDYDALAAFAFVRDRLGLEPYAGVLRGGEGALAARSGNAWDRALLLASLLDEMLVPYRFAFAELDEATVDALYQRSFQGPALPLPAGELGIIAADADAIAARARRDHALLRQALGDRIDQLGVPDEPAARGALRDHVWLQVELGPDLLDLDPSMPHLEPGDALATPSSTAATIPDEARHTVTLEVVVEQLHGGVLSASTVLDERLDAARAAGSEILLYFQPDVSGLGGSILEVLSGEERWAPVLIVDGVGKRGTPFTAGGRGTDLLGDPVDLPLLAGVRLILRRDGPGSATEHAERIILDRVPRHLDPDDLAPEDLAELPTAGGAPLALALVHHVLVSNGAADLREHALQRTRVIEVATDLINDPGSASSFALQDLLWPIAVAGQSVALASERMIVPGLTGRPDVRAFIARPRVFLGSVGPDPSGLPGAISITDLALDGVSVIGADGPDPGRSARHQLWYGALQSALETEHTLRFASALDPADRRLEAVSLAMTGPVGLVEPGSAARLGPGPAGSLVGSLLAGHLVVAVGDPSTTRLHWSITRDGFARSIVDPGLRAGIGAGNNYVNGGAVPTKYDIIDPRNGRIIGKVINGREIYYADLPKRPPKRVCRAASEYQAILDCISLAVAWVLENRLATIVIVIVVGASIIIAVN